MLMVATARDDILPRETGDKHQCSHSLSEDCWLINHPANKLPSSHFSLQTIHQQCVLHCYPTKLKLSSVQVIQSSFLNQKTETTIQALDYAARFGFSAHSQLLIFSLSAPVDTGVLAAVVRSTLQVLALSCKLVSALLGAPAMTTTEG